jgi:hypothetical protein
LKLAVTLLLIGATRHYGWAFWPDDLRSYASKMLGALCALALVCIITYLKPSKPLFWVAAVYAWEELQTTLCSAWYMVAPWQVATGQAMCSAKLGFDLGAVGILAIAICVLKVSIPVNSYSMQNDQEPRK